ncbi:TonB-dependent receptor [Aurantibacillus circumpalustris]|uniref:TonB-dependent receptor n=1 Tax=Aurantibacillus circumpalustris TaxID=3036359 RepID=UPI00295BD1F7|nr:TonB-dependent receptor [Aurantibacillus circumpalustris]
MKNIFILTLILSTTFLISVKAQNTSPTQNIRGVIIDKQSQMQIPGANVVLMGSDPIKGSVSNADGRFKITEVKAGRYDLKISYLGYKEIVLPNIDVSAGKEVVLEIGMEENISSLEEVVVSGSKKNETQNEMVSVSGRSFSMEEVNRYAGGRSDPSRLAANFAGVSSPDDSRNDIVIRGNSPTGVLWRIEGLNIPNPNHFSTVGTTGGPVSAINTNVIKNSDFFTSAFPAEYGNANAGVFDLGFRTGNSEKREHTIQLGALTGLEAMTEGPINKEKGSSYLLAYRYSFTGLAQQMGIPIGTAATPFYQDLSFKINGGQTKFGKFTLFGLGAKSKIEFLHDKIDSTDLFANSVKDSYFSSDIGLVGLKHFIKVNDKSYVNTVIGATYNGSNYLEDNIATDVKPLERYIENKSNQIHYSINTSFNSKINSRLFIKAGIISEVIALNLDARQKDSNNVWRQYWDFKDNTSLHQIYAQAKYRFSDRLTLNAGLHTQLLALNNSTSIEPRIGLKYQVSEKHTFSMGYGMHSQMQPTDVYFYRARLADGTYLQTNKDLDFTRSQHFVLGYDVLPVKDWRIKAEIYYQMLSNVPASETPGSFSMLNAGASFLPNDQSYLKNSGTGTNYGAELTIEKFFTKGYYALITATIYESKYKGSDGIERNTAFNGKYVYNVLAGKEFKLGKEKRNIISIGIKMTQAGGRYYTPVDLAASQISQSQVLQGDDYAFTQRNSDFFRFDVKIGFTLNSKRSKLSQSLFFDIQNVTNNKNVFAQRYNPVTNSVNTAYQIGFFPNFGYKIQF